MPARLGGFPDLDSHAAAGAGEHDHERVEAELVDATAHEVVEPRLRHPQVPCRRALRQPAGGEITKQARNWLGNKLDAIKRSQIMFIDRDDILNLFIVTNLPLPKGALPPSNGLDALDDEIPF